MEEHVDTKQEFSLYRRAKSFVHAGRGLCLFIKTTHNAWIHILVLLVAIIFGVYFDITTLEWALLILAAGFVFASEAFNTALEIDMNLTSPKYHPYARDTKDVAAGAVLISSITAGIIGIIIFGRYIKEL